MRVRVMSCVSSARAAGKCASADFVAYSPANIINGGACVGATSEVNECWAYADDLIDGHSGAFAGPQRHEHR